MSILNQQNFWKSFAKSTWEKKPVLIKNFNSPIREIKAEQIFSMLVDYSNYCRKIKKADGFKFYIDGQIQFDEETLQLLPQKKDRTLQGYHQRMEEIFEDYCLVCDELLQVSHENLKKLQAFTDNLFTHVGFPNRFVEVGLYLGNYRQTPFGVHVDGCGVFSFPVAGTKTFRLWTPEFAKKNPTLDRAHDYRKFKKNSQTMVASSGDMTYWPSTAWHIAESDGSFNATWSLGVWVDRTYQENVTSALEPLLKAKLGRIANETTTKLNSCSNLSENDLKAITALKNISENEWHDTLLKSWLILKSKKGFKNFPQIKSQLKLTLKSRIEIGIEQSILWSNLKSESKTIYVFQGNVFEDKPSLPMKKIIAKLNAGEVCLVSDYLKKPQDFKTLQALAKSGAFRSVR